MKNKKDLIKILIGILTLFLYLIGSDFYQEKPFLSEPKEVKVIEVIDGDTILVKDLQNDENFKVRYLGIDAPELEGPDYKTCFGPQAKEKNEDLVLDKKVILEFDRDRYDRFGRTLAYVFTVDEWGEKDIFVNLKLLEEGYARFYLDEQNTLYQDEFVETTLNTHDDFLGLWSECGESQFSGKCVIKGNVDRLGQKYYHLPGDKYYDVTTINLLKEDQWLCTIDEAEAKNFQRALK